MHICGLNSRYGVDSITASRPQFGTRGSYFSIFLQYASIIGWNCLLLILLGRATGRIALAAGWVQESNTGFISVVGSLTAIILSWLMLRRGADTIRNYAYFISIVVTGLGFWILYKLVSNVGVATIFDATPSASSGDKLWDYTAGFEILVASVLSWWPYMGGMVRMVPSARQSSWPAMLCMGLPTGVIALIGLYSALVLGDADPTTWLIELGGVSYGAFALLFLGLANVGTAVVGAYVASIGIKQIPYFQSRLNWNWTTFIVLLPVALIATIIPDLFFDHTGTFLAFLGVIFAPVVGIQITDYFFLRKGRLNLQGLYDNSAKSAYYFVGGVNPAACVAVVIGFITYIYLLNPVTFVSHGWFKYTSASLPAIFISAGAYYLVTKMYVLKAGIGGYGKAHYLAESDAGLSGNYEKA